MGFGDNGRVPRMNWGGERSPNAGNLPADHGLCLSLLGHGFLLLLVSRPMRGVPSRMLAPQGPP